MSVAHFTVKALSKINATVEFLHFFSGSSYNLLHHNCNNFSEDIAQFLCGASIPKYILDLPNEVLQSALSSTIQALTLQLEKSARPAEEEEDRARANFLRRSKEPSPDFEKLNSEIEEARSGFTNNRKKSGDSSSHVWLCCKWCLFLRRLNFAPVCMNRTITAFFG